MSGADSDYTRFPEDKPYPKANTLVKDNGPKVDTRSFSEIPESNLSAGYVDYPRYINVVPLTQQCCNTEVKTEQDFPTLDKAIERMRSEEDSRPALSAFEKELRKLINLASMESMSNTPDLILAEYLNSCLRAFNVATRARERWYGRKVF